MLIINGNVFDGKKFRKGLRVRLRDGIVTETGTDLTAEAGEEQTDLEGDYTSVPSVAREISRGSE